MLERPRGIGNAHVPIGQKPDLPSIPSSQLCRKEAFCSLILLPDIPRCIMRQLLALGVASLSCPEDDVDLMKSDAATA